MANNSKERLQARLSYKDARDSSINIQSTSDRIDIAHGPLPPLLVTTAIAA